MRLLQVSLRSSLIFSLILVVISIPVSLFSIDGILRKDNDLTLEQQANEFLIHIKSFEYLDDLETDLEVLDKLSYNISITPYFGGEITGLYETIYSKDSVSGKVHPYRQLSSTIVIKEKPYLLQVQLSLVDDNDLLFTIASVQAALIVILAGGLLLLNRSLSRKLWKPFYKTLNQLKAYEIDKNESIEMVNSDINEFDDLNKTVSHLTERNRKVFLEQKEFLEDVSHELQTPLAIIQTKLDLLMQSPTISAFDAVIIEELENTSRRMIRLNKNLLLLGKIKNEQFTTKEEIDIAPIVESTKRNMMPVAKGLEIKVTTSIQPLSLMANRTLVEILISNLMSNAVRYCERQGSVYIESYDRSLSFRNTGAPMKIDKEKMFERFVKDSSNPESSGLGLAIVYKICESCSFDLQYSYLEGQHNFVVSF